MKKKVSYTFAENAKNPFDNGKQVKFNLDTSQNSISQRSLRSRSRNGKKLGGIEKENSPQVKEEVKKGSRSTSRRGRN